MRPPVIFQTIPFFSSSSSDRRLNTLAKHFLQTESENNQNMSASPTSSHGDSVFAHLVRAPEDPILGVTLAYNKDPSPVKLNLGVGAYRTEEGKPLVLNVVRLWNGNSSVTRHATRSIFLLLE
ncbi:hypothetical protein S245_034564 [Arachis hypogaea]